MLSPAFFDDVFPTYKWLRENDPVHKIEAIDTWFVSRHADVTSILTDKENFSVEDMPITKAWHPDVRHALSSLFMDDPDHARLRGVVNNFFMPKTVIKREAEVSKIVDAAIESVRDSDKEIIDIEKEFAYTVPIDVLSMIMGLPKEDFVLFHEWAPKLAEALQPDQTEKQREEGGATARAIGEYLKDLFKAGNLRPKGEDTVLSLLKDGVDAGVMKEEELLTQAVQLYIGGHETTLSLIGKCILCLLTYPSELEKLKQNPELAAKMVDETVRFNGVSHVIVRRVARDYSLHGVVMQENDMLFVGNASANRDQSVYSDPDRYIIDREKRLPHMGFGRGLRYCLGNHLAKLEARLAVTALFRAFPDMALAKNSKPEFGTNLMLHGLLSLPVELNS